MVIVNSHIKSNIQRVSTTILFDRQQWDIVITAIDGKIHSDYRNVIAVAKYHNYSVKTRRANFIKIKKHVEKFLKNKI